MNVRSKYVREDVRWKCQNRCYDRCQNRSQNSDFAFPLALGWEVCVVLVLQRCQKETVVLFCANVEIIRSEVIVCSCFCSLLWDFTIGGVAWFGLILPHVRKENDSFGYGSKKRHLKDPFGSHKPCGLGQNLRYLFSRGVISTCLKGFLRVTGSPGYHTTTGWSPPVPFDSPLHRSSGTGGYSSGWVQRSEKLGIFRTVSKQSWLFT